MKSNAYLSRIVAIAAACSCFTSAAVAASVSTDPVSVMTYTIPSQSDHNVGVPLMRPAVFEGRIASVDTVNNTITFEGAPGWESDELALPEVHFVLIKSGVDEGMWLSIAANTSDTVGVTLRVGDTLANIAVGEIASVVPHWTPETLIGHSAPQLTHIFLYRNPEAGINHAASLTLAYLLQDWYNIGNYQKQYNVPLAPDEGFILRNSGPSVFTLTVKGVVPMVKQRSRIRTKVTGVEEDQRITLWSVVPQRLIDANLPVKNGDVLFSFENTTGMNHAPSESMMYILGQWYHMRNYSIVDASFEMKPGFGYIYRKAVTPAPEVVIWQNQPEYLE